MFLSFFQRRRQDMDNACTEYAGSHEPLSAQRTKREAGESIVPLATWSAICAEGDSCGKVALQAQ